MPIADFRLACGGSRNVFEIGNRQSEIANW
jgi:hypothetical protein